MFSPSLESRREHNEMGKSTRVREHIPIMVDEVVDHLACEEGKNYFDLTAGGGGHTRAILKATAPTGQVYACDRDVSALETARENLRDQEGRVQFLHNSIGQVGETFRQSPLPKVDGVLIDCGLSSLQLAEADRGFSFEQTGPLDMRMDRSTGLTAQEWLARIIQDDLAQTIKEWGEDRHYRRIARAIVNARGRAKIQTTTDLAQIIRSAIPAPARSRTIHPATRTFQAIRIAVNDELVELEEGVKTLLQDLPAGARIVVISFHSLEDRIIKNQFRQADKEGWGKVLTKKPLRPTDAEVRINPRSRSAKLRAFAKTSGEK